ncbi:hypothetical protein M427DRAFT_358174 [Gonapodya prolifera JEL478]|uniref:Uncharacterized protein n=1 Tax=Gonapodya prolifera (strain JEL478) TaxID=1344416 RepID=A0A139AAG3_GONPJ|nr:hypothetical protein M427DRAFT_358174 [Gonapodya prolifera JEL478]|eukprot:KXS13842.1 hypothetical protein M427DRAFT_358174 [Gonapodya prolifera JEL478]
MLDHAPRLAPNLLATRHFLSGTLGPQVREDLDDAVNLAKNWGGEECKKALEWIDAYRQLMTVDIPPLLISLSQSVTKASNRELDSLLRPLVPPIKRPSMPGLASTALKLTAAVEPGDPAFWDSFNRDSSGQGFESGVEAPARQPAAPLGFELPYRRDGSKTEFGFEQATVTLVGMRRPAYVRHILKISSELGSEETRIQPGEWADVAYRHGLLDG